MNLHELGLKHQTDKATYHNYLPFYEKYLDKNKIKKFLEIGIWQGDSIRMWREWFEPSTAVEAWDINPPLNVEGCQISQVDQTNREDMFKSLTEGVYDVILDDGAHRSDSMEISLGALFPFTKYYIVEDLHAQFLPEDYQARLGFIKDGEIALEQRLDEFSKFGKFKSYYMTDEEKDYFEKNAVVVEFWYQRKLNEMLSATCLIRNKAYGV
jgi:hypothetical protein